MQKTRVSSAPGRLGRAAAALGLTLALLGGAGCDLGPDPDPRSVVVEPPHLEPTSLRIEPAVGSLAPDRAPDRRAASPPR